MSRLLQSAQTSGTIVFMIAGLFVTGFMLLAVMDKAGAGEDVANHSMVGLVVMLIVFLVGVIIGLVVLP